MRKLFLFFICALGWQSSTLVAQPLQSKDEVLATMRLANNYFMSRWPDAGAPMTTIKEYASNIWTRGVYYEGLMALYSVETDAKEKEKYVNYAMDWGNKHQWTFRHTISTRNADNQCAGQTFYDLYVITGRKNQYMMDSTKASVDKMLATNKIDDWSWIDALQMGMPLFTRLGVEYKNTAYFDRMYEMYAYTKYKQGKIGLYNQAEKLWWRDRDFVPPYKEPNGKNCYWSRGNGWVVAALVKVIDMLPKSDPHYNEYLQDYKDMCASLIKLQREDGYWNVSLMDPTNFGGKEMTGTALFTYGFAYGVNNGLLDKKTYMPAITKAWNAMATECVHPCGFLGWVQGTGKEPKDGQPLGYHKTPDFEDYGLGCFLLAGSEVYKIER